jgi:hypothetical protein
MLCYGSLSVHVTQTHERDRAALPRKPVSVFLAEPEAHSVQLGLARLAASVKAQDFLALFFADAEAIAAEVACHGASIRSQRLFFSKIACVKSILAGQSTTGRKCCCETRIADAMLVTQESDQT